MLPKRSWKPLNEFEMSLDSLGIYAFKDSRKHLEFLSNASKTSRNALNTPSNFYILLEIKFIKTQNVGGAGWISNKGQPLKFVQKSYFIRLRICLDDKHIVHGRNQKPEFTNTNAPCKKNEKWRTLFSRVHTYITWQASHDSLHDWSFQMKFFEREIINNGLARKRKHQKSEQSLTTRSQNYLKEVNWREIENPFGDSKDFFSELYLRAPLMILSELSSMEQL